MRRGVAALGRGQACGQRAACRVLEGGESALCGVARPLVAAALERVARPVVYAVAVAGARVVCDKACPLSPRRSTAFLEGSAACGCEAGDACAEASAHIG